MLKKFLKEKSEALRLIVSFVVFLIAVISLKLNFEPPVVNTIIPPIFFILSWAISGASVLKCFFENILHKRFFDETFLMTIASVGAFVLGEFFEGACVMLLYNLGEAIQDMAVTKSRNRIKSFLTQQKEEVCVVENGEQKIVKASDVQLGATILVKPGEKVLIDGILTEGSASLETSSLTGESIPTVFTEGEKILSGFIVSDKPIIVRTTSTYNESTISKMQSLISKAQRQKAKPEKFISSFAKKYTPIVTCLAVLISVVPPLISYFVIGGELLENFKPWVYRGLVFLTISCPCALVLSIPLTYFSSIGALAKSGILVKQSSLIDAAYKLETCIFDKTGTLTERALTVSDVKAENGFTENELLQFALEGEKMSNHIIALAIVKYCKEKGISSTLNTSDFTEVSGKGIKLKINEKTLMIGNENFFTSSGLSFFTSKKNGHQEDEKLKVLVAYDGIYVGAIYLDENLRQSSYSLVNKLKALGVTHTVMLTGDNEVQASRICKSCNIDEYKASLLPNEKCEIVKSFVEKAKQVKRTVSFIGDGINDGLSLSASDIGISFANNSSGIAIEASNVIFLSENLNLLPMFISHAKKTTHIVRENIIFTIGIKVVCLLFGAFGGVSMILAIFADVGACLLAILNGLRTSKLK